MLVALMCVRAGYVRHTTYFTLWMQDDEEWTTTDDIEDDVDESNSIYAEQVCTAPPFPVPGLGALHAHSCIFACR